MEEYPRIDVVRGEGRPQFFAGNARFPEQRQPWASMRRSPCPPAPGSSPRREKLASDCGNAPGFRACASSILRSVPTAQPIAAWMLDILYLKPTMSGQNCLVWPRARPWLLSVNTCS